MNKYYTKERSQQIVISLLKKKGIRKVVASPGTTNITLVASMQQDPFFEIYSSVDERSAGYIAIGLAAESNEPVVLSCTGATASRNYMSALTEAYYRKLPILAITATQGEEKCYHNIPQVIDRSTIPNDIAKLSVNIRNCKDEQDEWEATIKANNAILELTRNGGGPVHINLATTYSRDFSVKELPYVREVDRITTSDGHPKIPESKKIAIFIGSHKNFSEEETNAIDAFCTTHNAIALCDHTSGYKGRYAVHHALPFAQTYFKSIASDIDLLIHIGGISGDYYTTGKIKPKEVWRVSLDGELCDTFKALRYVFQMPDLEFFKYYAKEGHNNETFLNNCNAEYEKIYNAIEEVPFSNIWIAKNTASLFPQNAIVHLGILNSLRSWNFFKFPMSIDSYCNVGGFGIDGIISTLVGGALAQPQRLHFAILGDLAFFYDMNTLGNRHFPKNIRILLINNGKGVEFRNYDHPGSAFGEKADEYIAAGGHYAKQSNVLVKSYAQSLGFEYISAATKEDFLQQTQDFFNTETAHPIIFEVFTNTKEETDALQQIRTTINEDKTYNVVKKQGAILAKKILSDQSYKKIKETAKKFLK